MRTGRTVAALVLAGPLAAGCTADGAQPEAAQPRSSTSPPTTTPTTTPTSPPTTQPTDETDSPPAPSRFRAAAAMETVTYLAGTIGPRLATSPAFDRAASWVGRRLERLGYTVSRQPIRVPAGSSWGVPVDAGTSVNVVATPRDFDPIRSWRLVGAHLDSVAVAPGAEDNASGVAVLLELARLAAEQETALPTVFVAYGAEEPVGDGEALHHFGSRLHVDRLPGPQREALRAMVSLDRVGVGAEAVVPICTGGISPTSVRDDLLALARRLDVETSACTDNTTSDHWSYEQEGLTVARIGSTEYAAYHSEADIPSVVSPAQLGRVGRIMWVWLQG